MNVKMNVKTNLKISFKVSFKMSLKMMTNIGLKQYMQGYSETETKMNNKLLFYNLRDFIMRQPM